MFGLGFVEVILIAVLALIFIGPKQLPEVARVVARLLNDWRRATRDFTASFTETQSDLRRSIEAPPLPPPVSKPDEAKKDEV